MRFLNFLRKVIREEQFKKIVFSDKVWIQLWLIFFLQNYKKPLYQVKKNSIKNSGRIVKLSSFKIDRDAYIKLKFFFSFDKMKKYSSSEHEL